MPGEQGRCPGVTEVGLGLAKVKVAPFVLWVSPFSLSFLSPKVRQN